MAKWKGKSCGVGLDSLIFLGFLCAFHVSRYALSGRQVKNLIVNWYLLWAYLQDCVSHSPLWVAGSVVSWSSIWRNKRQECFTLLLKVPCCGKGTHCWERRQLLFWSGLCVRAFTEWEKIPAWQGSQQHGWWLIALFKLQLCHSSELVNINSRFAAWRTKQNEGLLDCWACPTSGTPAKCKQ